MSASSPSPVAVQPNVPAPASENRPAGAPAAESTTKRMSKIALGVLAVLALALFAFALAGKIPTMGSITSPTTLLVGVAAGSIAFSMLCLMGLLYLRQNKEVEPQIKFKNVLGTSAAQEQALQGLNEAIERQASKIKDLDAQLAALWQSASPQSGQRLDPPSQPALPESGSAPSLIQSQA